MKGTLSLISRLDSHRTALVSCALSARNAAAAAAYASAVRAVPVRTGRLRASITHEGGRVFTRCPYAAYVEQGTRFTRAQPFLSPAADIFSYRRLAESAFREAIL